jgi:hypothetical protein
MFNNFDEVEIYRIENKKKMDGNLRGDKIFFSLKNDSFSRRIF